MKVYHIEFAKTGSGISGGEKCMIEIIKYFINRGVKNVLLTTDNGKVTYEKLGLIEGEYLHYIIIDSSYTEKKRHIFFSYLSRIGLFFNIKHLITEGIDRENDILMCHSDFFPNVIPTFLLKKSFKKPTFWWFHMVSPDIFKGYEGHFTNKFRLPSLAVIHYKLNQVLFFLASKRGVIITVNPYYERLFGKKDIYTLKKFGGENVYTIKKYSGVSVKDSNQEKEKRYDIAFMGRFHRQKGLLEIPRIVEELKKYRSNVKLVVIGDGDPILKKEFLDLVNEKGLNDNIECVGFISSDEKFEYLKLSKVFIFPSYYESFGQVALEAMANGLPVVAYDLPVFCVFEKGMTKVPIGNNVHFAKAISRLITDSDLLRDASKEAMDYASTFSWAKTGEEVFDLIKSV